MANSVEDRAGELMTIPLSMLVPSTKFNVRKAGGVSIPELAASIEAQGLLQNLTAIAPQRGGGKYEVVAGKRRLEALQVLAKAGKIKRDEEITCKVTTVENAVAASLAENTQRAQMHPADEFEAFRRLIDDGRSVEDVAAAFGLSPLTVQRRMRLGRLAPELLDLYRHGDANLEQLMALALVDDHATQLRVWRDAPKHQRDAYYLRRAITGAEVDAATHPVAKFVAVKAYEKAGGALRRDLFAEQDTGYIIDVDLLHRLASEKVASQVEKVRGEGWAWVEPRLVISHADTSDFTHARMAMRALNKSEQGRLDKLDGKIAGLTAELDTLYGTDDEADDARADRLQSELDAVEKERDRLVEQYQEWTAETKAIAGALVGIDHGGRSHVVRGLIRPQDRKAAVAQLPAEVSGVGAREASEPRTHSEALTRRLTAHRTLGIQWAMTQQPRVAFAVLAHALAASVLDGVCADSASSVRGNDSIGALTGAAGEDIEATATWVRLREARERWTATLGASGGDGITLAKVMALPDAELTELLALCAALTVNVTTHREDDAVGDELHNALRVDMTQWWKPTAQSYFNSVSKSRIAEVIREARPDVDAKALASKKKAELAEYAGSLLADSGWLPEVMRAQARAVADQGIDNV
jgi:ParB family chromosome partitioning protein